MSAGLGERPHVVRCVPVPCVGWARGEGKRGGMALWVYHRPGEGVGVWEEVGYGSECVCVGTHVPCLGGRCVGRSDWVRSFPVWER